MMGTASSVLLHIKYMVTLNSMIWLGRCALTTWYGDFYVVMLKCFTCFFFCVGSTRQ